MDWPQMAALVASAFGGGGLVVALGRLLVGQWLEARRKQDDHVDQELSLHRQKMHKLSSYVMEEYAKVATRVGELRQWCEGETKLLDDRLRRLETHHEKDHERLGKAEDGVGRLTFLEEERGKRRTRDHGIE